MQLGGHEWRSNWSGLKSAKAKTRRALVSRGPRRGVLTRDHTPDPLKVVYYTRTPCPRALGLTSDQGHYLRLVRVSESPIFVY